MNRILIPSLAVGWAGSVAGWLTTAHPILSLVSTMLASLASLYAIVVWWRTARLRRLEIEVASRKLCERCRDGHPPAVCPLPIRPDNCPLNPKKR